MPEPMQTFEYRFRAEHRPYLVAQVHEAVPNLDYYSLLSRYEHEQLRDHIGRPRRVMDLGCGLGRAAIYLNHALQDPSVRYVLADTTCATDVPGCWDHLEYGPWNDLALTESFARLNGLVNFEVFDIHRDPWERLRMIDFVTSRCSVGMHFPIEDAMPKLLPILAADCTLIFGVRGRPYYAGMFGDLFEDVVWLPERLTEEGRVLPRQDWLILRRKK